MLIQELEKDKQQITEMGDLLNEREEKEQFIKEKHKYECNDIYHKLFRNTYTKTLNTNIKLKSGQSYYWSGEALLVIGKEGFGRWTTYSDGEGKTRINKYAYWITDFNSLIQITPHIAEIKMFLREHKRENHAKNTQKLLTTIKELSQESTEVLNKRYERTIAIITQNEDPYNTDRIFRIEQENLKTIHITSIQFKGDMIILNYKNSSNENQEISLNPTIADYVIIQQAYGQIEEALIQNIKDLSETETKMKQKIKALKDSVIEQLALAEI